MLKSDYADQNCSIARSLELVGERWTILVLRDVFLGRRRFDQIRQSLGGARNVLASRLARLVGEGILEKVPSRGPAPPGAARPGRSCCARGAVAGSSARVELAPAEVIACRQATSAPSPDPA